MKYLFVCSRLDTMYDKRKELVLSLLSKGHQVAFCSMERHQGTEEDLKKQGIEFYHISCTRNRLSVSGDFSYVLRLWRLIKRLKPDVLVSYTIKPNIYSGISVLTRRSVRFYPVITGLGFAFQANSIMRKALRKFVVLLHKVAFSTADIIIFQNNHNLNVFLDEKIARDNVAVIEGDGVLIPPYKERNFGSSRRFVIVSRLLGEKGLRELNEAALTVRRRNPDFCIELYGPTETSPDAITPEELESWKSQGALVWMGYCSDVGGLLEDSDIFVLPSYHEGMSTAVCEAIAHGLPVIGTDIPGIREMIEGNGYLVPPRSADMLAEALEKMIDASSEELARMSEKSLEIAKSRFDRSVVMSRIEKVIS